MLPPSGGRRKLAKLVTKTTCTVFFEYTTVSPDFVRKNNVGFRSVSVFFCLDLMVISFF